MPPLFPIGLALMAIAILVSLLRERSEKAERARAEAEARGTIEATGLAVDGNPLGSYSLRGQFATVDLVLDNGKAEKLPGPSSETSTVCMVRVDAPLPDMVVCSASEIDRVMGPLPSAERVRTGHAGFDARYAVFIAREQSHYRGVEPASAGPWAAPATLDRLLDLDLAWMRVREGKVEIALAVLSPEDVARGLAVGANVARASRGEALIDVRPGVVEPRPLVPGSMGGCIAWMITGAVGLIGGFVASFFEFFREIDQEAVCGQGAKLLHTTSDSDGGTNHDFHCSNNQDGALILLHCLSCMLIVGAICALVLVVALRRPKVLHLPRRQR